MKEVNVICPKCGSTKTRAGCGGVFHFGASALLWWLIMTTALFVILLLGIYPAWLGVAGCEVWSSLASGDPYVLSTLPVMLSCAMCVAYIVTLANIIVSNDNLRYVVCLHCRGKFWCVEKAGGDVSEQ